MPPTPCAGCVVLRCSPEVAKLAVTKLLSLAHACSFRVPCIRFTRHATLLLHTIFEPGLTVAMQEGDAFKTAPYNGNRTVLGGRIDDEYLADIVPDFFRSASLGIALPHHVLDLPAARLLDACAFGILAFKT